MKKNIIISKTAQKCMLALMTAILIIAFATSCNKSKSITDDEPGGSKDPESIYYKEVNEWILENMQVYYLWNTKIPSKTDQTLSPDEYFESLLYRPTDRFSWIQKDYVELLNSLSGVNTEAGYDFSLFRISNSGVMGYITYIKPNTPAETAKLKRGDLFYEINGTKMTMDNYSSLIAKTSEPHTLGLYAVEQNTLSKVNDVSLDVIENYPENPILLDTVYNISDKNIGYFVYNFFARDKGDGSVAYEKELNNIFAKFKSEQIDELIVDLRYNGGGAVITAEALASMISGQDTSDVFYINEYNFLIDNELKEYYGADYNKSYFINSIVRSDNSGKTIEEIPINSLQKLSKVYFIVTERSASASELLINGLKPYMDVVLVGETTYGKNVASITIYEEDLVKQKTNKWGMQPIIMKMSNADGFSDYGNGFTPDEEISEFDGENLIFKQLGDTEELLLKTTIDKIFGRTKSVAKTKHIGSQAIFVGSAIDRTPVRRNQYISLKDLAKRNK
jgi:C-terminal processing protease CtpA/Prc